MKKQTLKKLRLTKCIIAKLNDENLSLNKIRGGSNPGNPGGGGGCQSNNHC